MSEHPPGGFMTPLADPVSIPGLVTILEAVRRGARLSSFWRLSVVCRNGHGLVQVFATTAGPVLYAPGRGRLGALALDGRAPSVRVCVFCRCGQFNLPVSFINDRLALGIRHAAYP